MTEPRPGRHDDDHSPEHFLVDGVAPPVIGGGPPESPFELEPDPEPPTRHRTDGQAPRGPAPRHASGPYGQPAPAQAHHNPPAGFAQQHYPPAGDYRAEPPTSPIPALQPPEQAPEKRKSWVSRVFRLPG